MRRGTEDEIEIIRRRLREMFGGTFDWQKYFWEHRWPQPVGEVEMLPPELWRYFVVKFQGANSTMHLIQSASDFALIELESGFGVTRWGSGMTAEVGINT